MNGEPGMWSFNAPEGETMDFGPSGPEYMLTDMFDQHVPITADDGRFNPAWKSFKDDVLSKMSPELRKKFLDRLAKKREGLTRLGPETSRAKAHIDRIIGEYEPA